MSSALVTVKIVPAEIPPAVAETFTTPGPSEAGTENVQGVPVPPGKLPVELVAQEELTEWPPTVKLTVDDAAKPDPVASTRVSAGPCEGVRTRVPRMRKVAEAVLPPG